MTNQQLLDYIRSQQERNVDRPEIRSALITAGWPESLIDEAFFSLDGRGGQAAESPPLPGVALTRGFFTRGFSVVI